MSDLQELKDGGGLISAIGWYANPFNIPISVSDSLIFLQGNVALWKPSDSSVLSNYIAFQAYREAGLPPGVINFVPADGPVFGDTLLASPHLAGINFTGSLR